MSSPRNGDPLSKPSLSSIPFVTNPLARYLLRVIGSLMAVGSILVIALVGTTVNEVTGFTVGILVLVLGVFLRWMGVRRRPKNV